MLKNEVSVKKINTLFNLDQMHLEYIVQKVDKMHR
jgi:hypothetical protein